ncbi:uncharacterized protein METZ01_LOCUS476080, partial [marine metagenome]
MSDIGDVGEGNTRKFLNHSVLRYLQSNGPL